MGFSCSCDDVRVDFFNVAFPRARKQYTCCECSHVIEPGETYERAAGKCEGDMWSSITCERCADLRQSFIDLGFCASCGGGLFEDYADWLDDGGQTKRDDDGDRELGYVTANRIRAKHRDWRAA